MAPGALVPNPISAISLGLALMFGTAGLPHILMRFFTVADAKAARKSVFYATGFIGYFYILTFIIGFGAITLVLMTDPSSCYRPAQRREQQDRGDQGRHQHGGDPPRQRGRRQLLPRLHLGGGLRHHPRGGVGPDAGGRLGDQPRPLRPVVKQAARPTSRTRSASRRSRPWCSASSPSSSASCSRTRTSPSWSASPSPIAASLQLPGAADVDVLEGHDHARRADRRLPRPDLGAWSCVDAVAGGVGSDAAATRRVRRRSPTTTRRCSR